MEPLLMAPDSAGRATESTGDVILICIPCLEQRHRGICLGSTIPHVIVQENESLHEYGAMGTLGSDTDAVIDNRGP